MPHTCPKCGKYALHRSHSQNAAEHLIKTLLPIRPYRCSECQWRGWRLRKRSVINKKRVAKNLLLYAVVLIVAIFFSLVCMKGFLQ